MQSHFWNEHYKSFKLQGPSDFAQYCLRRHLDKSDTLVELGCGNGRDGLLLSGHVERYIGLDLCKTAIQAFRNAAGRQAASETVDIQQADFTQIDLNALAQPGRRLALYSRFSLHAITYGEQDRLIEHIAKIEDSPWIWMIEARTIYDALYGMGRKVGRHEFETDHYRRFIDPAVFLQDMAGRFTVKYFEVSDGFAIYGKENPVVMRAALERQQTPA